MSEIEQLRERIKELEYQLAVSRGNFSQERNLFKAEANSLTAERIKCEQQNAKLVKALERIVSLGKGMPDDAYDTLAAYEAEIAREALGVQGE